MAEVCRFERPVTVQHDVWSQAVEGGRAQQRSGYLAVVDTDACASYNAATISKEEQQSDPIFRFWTGGDWWGFPFFSLSASRYFGDRETLCLYWPLGTVLITGSKVLDFYAGFCAHRATCLKADGKDITDLKLMLNGDFTPENEASAAKR